MERFHRVGKSEPCPVCGHFDWCVVSNDGGTAICFRMESDRPHSKGGWVHILKHTLPDVRCTFTPKRTARRVQLVDMERIMQGFRAEFEGDGVKRDVFDSAIELGAELGIPGAVADRLHCGRSDFYKAWAFPMRDGDGRCVGVRLREYGTSRKWSVAGSRDGLFYDPELELEETFSNGLKGREIVIVEGASDAAAGYALALATVGRSSCNTGADALKRLCDRLKANRVTIVTDNDRFKERTTYSPRGVPIRRTVWRPGIDGALRLAHDLGRMFRLVTPPKKDLRDWLESGLTIDVFRTVADAQKWKMPKNES